MTFARLSTMLFVLLLAMAGALLRHLARARIPPALNRWRLVGKTRDLTPIISPIVVGLLLVSRSYLFRGGGLWFVPGRNGFGTRFQMNAHSTHGCNLTIR